MGPGTATPTLASLPTGNGEIVLAGLPAAHELTAGDLLSFKYGTAPVRYALHRVAVGGVADATGTTPALVVTPQIRPGAAIGVPVTLGRPHCKAILVPGSVSPGRRDIIPWWMA